MSTTSRLQGLANAWPLNTTVKHSHTGLQGVVELCPAGEPIAAERVGGIRVAHLFLGVTDQAGLVWVKWDNAWPGWIRPGFLRKATAGPKVIWRGKAGPR